MSSSNECPKAANVVNHIYVGFPADAQAREGAQKEQPVAKAVQGELTHGHLPKLLEGMFEDLLDEETKSSRNVLTFSERGFGTEDIDEIRRTQELTEERLTGVFNTMTGWVKDLHIMRKELDELKALVKK